MAVEKPDDILKEFHEILQRCCQLEDTLLKNVGLLNCIKNNEANSPKDLKQNQEQLKILTQKTDTLTSEMSKLTTKVFLCKKADLQSLEKRRAKAEEVHEKSKEKFLLLLNETEKGECA